MSIGGECVVFCVVPKVDVSSQREFVFVAANDCRVVMSVDVPEVLLPSAVLKTHGYVNFGTSSAKVIVLC